ncbi:hypothetical protein NKJ26_03070 [Mesorhizobium sp. M0152]|uniref:hypothetical protein n=1 Tax=Mesorhizobium sp. M0152 TaxID=2956898 RepID=UPI00333C84DE
MGSGIIAWLLSRLSPAAIALISLLALYEGVPVAKEIVKAVAIIRYVPGVGPAVEYLALGRVDRAERAGHDAGVAEERAAWVKAAETARQNAADLRAADAIRQAEAERKYLAERAERAIHAGELKEIINDLENAPKTVDCRDVPSVSRRLSIGLDAAGRKEARRPANDG